MKMPDNPQSNLVALCPRRLRHPHWATMQAILELLSHKPAILRGNASEILALAGATGVCKGVDSTAETWDALEAGKQLAKRYGNVVAISGKEDLVGINCFYAKSLLMYARQRYVEMSRTTGKLPG